MLLAELYPRKHFPLNNSTKIELSDNQTSLTSHIYFDVDHCPGAVMYLPYLRIYEIGVFKSLLLEDPQCAVSVLETSVLGSGFSMILSESSFNQLTLLSIACPYYYETEAISGQLASLGVWLP